MDIVEKNYVNMCSDLQMLSKCQNETKLNALLTDVVRYGVFHLKNNTKNKVHINY